MKSKLLIILLLLSIFTAATGWGGEVAVQARVDRTRISLDETLRLSVVVSGGPGTVDLSPIQDFKVTSRASSTNIQMVNGRFSKEVRYDYTLVPLKTGQLTVPALAVASDSETLHSKPIAITVNPENKTGGKDVDLFVEAEVSDPAPFVGQEIIYRFRFHNAVRVADGARFQPPDFTGFNARQVEKESVFEKIVGERRYQVTELVFILIPNEKGKQVISPAALQCGVLADRQRNAPRSRLSPFFDDSFFRPSRIRTRVLRTDPVTVDVHPLPTVPGNMAFSGLVGKFTLHAEADRLQIATDDSATMTFTVRGQGNIMDAPRPTFSLPEGMKIYDDAPEEDITVDGNGTRGSKRFRFALVPVRQEPGPVSIPPVDLVFFDPETETYRRTASQPVTLILLPPEKGDVAAPAPVSASAVPEKIRKKTVRFTGRDILPLKRSLDALQPAAAMGPAGFAAWMATPMLLFLLVTVILARTRKTMDDRSLMAKRAVNELKKAARATSDTDNLSALHGALVFAVLSAGGKSGASLTASEANTILTAAGRPAEEIEQVVGMLDRIESVRFGGAGETPEKKKTIDRETRRLVRRLCR
jgi:BatD DUF11 like domain